MLLRQRCGCRRWALLILTSAHSNEHSQQQGGGRYTRTTCLDFYFLICSSLNSPNDSFTDQRRGGLLNRLSTIKRGSPDPEQRFSHRLRIASWAPPKCLYHRINIEAVERGDHGTWIELRDQSLLLITSNQRNPQFIETVQKLLPVLLEPFVGSGRIGYRTKEGTALIANANQLEDTVWCSRATGSPTPSNQGSLGHRVFQLPAYPVRPPSLRAGHGSTGKTPNG